MTTMTTMTTTETKRSEYMKAYYEKNKERLRKQNLENYRKRLERDGKNKYHVSKKELEERCEKLQKILVENLGIKSTL